MVVVVVEVGWPSSRVVRTVRRTGSRAGPSLAQEADPPALEGRDYSRSGFYVGIGIVGGVYTQIEDEIEDQLAALGHLVNVETDATVGFKLVGGYRLSPHFGIEIECEMLSETDIDISDLGVIGDFQSWTFTGNAKWLLMTGRVQPYLLGGLGIMEVEFNSSVGPGFSTSDSDLAIRFAGGFDVYLTEHVVAYGGVDYVLPTGDVKDLDYLSFGAGV